MNKEDAQKEIEKAQKKFDKLQKKLDIARDQIAWAERMLEEAEPDTSELVFNPEKGSSFYYVDECAEIDLYNRTGQPFDNRLVKIGNCFRTEEDAQNSAKHYIMNSDYEYWFPWIGQPKPKVLPKALEWWSIQGVWFKSKKNCVNWQNYVYRWKREDQ